MCGRTREFEIQIPRISVGDFVDRRDRLDPEFDYTTVVSDDRTGSRNGDRRNVSSISRATAQSPRDKRL